MDGKLRRRGKVDELKVFDFVQVVAMAVTSSGAVRPLL